MSKKTWTTVLIVLLVVAAIVAIYFLTRPEAKPVEPVATEAPATDAPAELPAEVTATDAPAAPTAAPAGGGGNPY